MPNSNPIEGHEDHPAPPLDGMPRIGGRRWIAWKLVQLAHRVYDAEYYEQISIFGPDDDTPITEFIINADLYGGGVSVQIGDGCLGNGYCVQWTDDYVPDWLTEGGGA